MLGLGKPEPLCAHLKNWQLLTLANLQAAGYIGRTHSRQLKHDFFAANRETNSSDLGRNSHHNKDRRSSRQIPENVHDLCSSHRQAVMYLGMDSSLVSRPTGTPSVLTGANIRFLTISIIL